MQMLRLNAMHPEVKRKSNNKRTSDVQNDARRFQIGRCPTAMAIFARSIMRQVFIFSRLVMSDRRALALE